ncbi:MAG: DNA-3-methyladenine glycosylase family protein [Thermomicrobiales bacterium]
MPLPAGFDLGQTCGPVAWAGGRWPDMDWRDGELISVGWQEERVVWRQVRQRGEQLVIVGSAPAAADEDWASRVLGLGMPTPVFDDPIMQELALRFSGLRPFSMGSLYVGLLTSIVGQSISVAAAIAQTKLAALFSDPVPLAGREFRPLPRAEQLAAADPALVRTSGVTNRRAAALVAIAGVAARAELPAMADAVTDPEGVEAALRDLPLVGPWTARSALLWGTAAPDAHPTGDVALLRAARLAYGMSALDLRGLDALSDAWRPARGFAARLLWTDLLGVAPSP